MAVNTRETDSSNQRRSRLTKRDVDGARFDPQGKDCQWLWDGELRGFGIRLYPSGSKAYVMKYRAHGQQHIEVLGSVEALTMDQARAAAKQAMGEVAGGQDPFLTKREESKEPTFREFALTYLKMHAKPHKRSWRNDATQLEKLILPEWGARKIGSIGGGDVTRLHRKLGQEHGLYQANRTLATLSKMFELARKWGYLPPAAVNPARGVEKFKEEKRHRPIESGELPRLWAAIDEEPSPYVQAAFRLLLFLGCRRGELLSAKWEQVDFEQGQIIFPHTKAGRAFVAPLSGPALAILRSLPRAVGNPYILPGHVTGKPLDNLTKPWKRVLERAGLPHDIRIHDLRHTFGTTLSNAGVSLTIVGAAMNHSQPSVTARYAQPVQDPVRQASEELAETILRQATVKEGS